MSDETAIGGPRRDFRETCWTHIRRARDGSREDLERLLGDYWKPIYWFIRRKGFDVDRAKDLTQGFCASFIESPSLAKVAPEHGRFRSFVMACVQHYISDSLDRERARKRGGDRDFVQAEADLVAASDPTPETAFYRGWAATTFGRAMDRLRKETPAEEIAVLEGRDVPGVEGDRKKNLLRRLRARLRDHLRSEIRPLVDSESDVDAEMDELHGNLAPE